MEDPSHEERPISNLKRELLDALQQAKRTPTFTELCKHFKLRGAEKKLAKRILLQFERAKKGKPTAKGTKKVPTSSRRTEPAQTQFVGTLARQRKNTFFHPVLQKRGELSPISFVPHDLENLPADTVVLAKKTREAVKIVGALGSIDDGRIDSKMIAWKFALPPNFPKACVSQAEELPLTISGDEHRHRKDLRTVPFVTIDGEDAKDFDDAVALDEDGSLWIAVADVAHFVRQGTALDDEAARRGNSFYFPDSVIPMLPEKISNFLCSLRPDEDKLCMAVRIRVDDAGDVSYDPPLEGVMRSKARLTYEAVDRFFSTGESLRAPEGVEAMLSSIRPVVQRMFRRRMEQGGVDFDLSEVKFDLDARGRVSGIKKRVRTAAQGLIEELMLAANRSVASYMLEAKIPSVYRVHDFPDETAVQDFVRFVRALGWEVDAIDPSHSKEFNELLQSLGTGTETRILRQMALRTMKQAYYSPKNHGHFGLGFEDYLHFTSPIRRYSDLVVHRSLKNHLHRRSSPLFPDFFGTLDNLCLYISDQERVAQKTEFEIRDVKSIRYLEDQIGKTFSGVVTTAIASGLFVELDEIPVEGFVHVSRLGDDHYLYREDLRAFVGKRKKKRYGVTDRIEVKLEKASLVDLRIDFQPVRS